MFLESRSGTITNVPAILQAVGPSQTSLCLLHSGRLCMDGPNVASIYFFDPILFLFVVQRIQLERWTCECEKFLAVIIFDFSSPRNIGRP